jgi:2-polyprenyl-6-methoxyphenol hydroxylase-like FAD-dependent oxidoreductase
MITNTPPAAVVEIPAYGAACKRSNHLSRLSTISRRLLPGSRHQVIITTPQRPPAIGTHSPKTGRRGRLLPDCLGRGRIIILGEAAHPVPSTGLEAGIALEDAAELAAAVQEYGRVGGHGVGVGKAPTPSRGVGRQVCVSPPI